jgi:hypothetical protein
MSDIKITPNPDDDGDGAGAERRARARRAELQSSRIVDSVPLPPPPAPPSVPGRPGRGMFAYVPPAPPPPVDYSTLLQLSTEDERPGATELIQNLLSLINSVSAASGICSDGKHWTYHAKATIEKRLLDPDGKNLETVLPAFAPGLISKTIIEDLNEARGGNRAAFGQLTLKDLVMSANGNLQHNAIKKGMGQELLITASSASVSSGGIRLGSYGADRMAISSAMAYKTYLRAKIAAGCGKCDYRLS